MTAFSEPHHSSAVGWMGHILIHCMCSLGYNKIKYFFQQMHYVFELRWVYAYK